MATEVQRLWFAAHAPAREESAGEDLARACEELLAGGPVSFDFSTRADLLRLPRPKRLTVAVMRSVPEPFYVPPDLNVKECVFDEWDAAVDACESPDDQILVRARNRFFRRGMVSPALCCRPRDPSDAARFRVLDSVFGGLPGNAERVAAVIRGELEEGIVEAARRLVEKCSQV